ncbi:hypothetical protein [Natrialbaceae archaeon AArc-T1-2]|uniref:hypothetical protein n=1 Tax=Natrialbaceae archaeon AArc-T1-2 TaxID=3053904 RepID=UPI00255B1CB7|nr:hypothetical protein [Natrialbaceae archaeon AArc-T1-2]WIV68370.1 hypothetical protein QQ977_06520 [Natrialbaceae archaeon AArc-T1-2]
MSRIAFGLLGSLIALFPADVLEAFERATLENPEESRPKSWLVSGIRAEGIGYVLVGVVGGKSYAWLMNLIGIVGVVVTLFPKRYLEVGGRLAYENSEDLEWREGFVTATRGIGVLCVLLALRAAKNRDG